jgi:TetR/AcrR family transcriptional regulator, acrEF/envCD operon repressor
VVSRLTVAQRRAHLISAAVRLAERKGVTGVTTRDVAKQAGVSLGVVHYCFENKDALMAELLRALAGALRDCVESDPRALSSTGTGRAALCAALQSALNLVWLNVEAGRRRQLLGYETLTFALRAAEVPTTDRRDDAVTAIAAEQYALVQVRVGELMEQAAAATAMRWPEPAAPLNRFAVSVLDGVVLRWLADDDSDSARAQLDFAAAALADLAEPLG